MNLETLKRSRKGTRTEVPSGPHSSGVLQHPNKGEKGEIFIKWGKTKYSKALGPGIHGVGTVYDMSSSSNQRRDKTRGCQTNGICGPA